MTNNITYKNIPDFVLSSLLSRKTIPLASGNWDLLLCIVQSFIERDRLKDAGKCSLLLRYLQEIVFPNDGTTIHQEEMIKLNQDFSSIDHLPQNSRKNVFFNFFKETRLESYSKHSVNKKLFYQYLKENIVNLFPDILTHKSKNWDHLVDNVSKGEGRDTIVRDLFVFILPLNYFEEYRFFILEEVCEILFLEDKNSKLAREILEMHIKVLDIPIATKPEEFFSLWVTSPIKMALKFGHIDIAIKGIKRCFALGHASELEDLHESFTPYFEKKADYFHEISANKLLKLLEMVPVIQGQILCDIAGVFFNKGEFDHSFRILSLILDENIRYDEYLFWLLNLEKKSISKLEKECQIILNLSGKILGNEKEANIDQLLEAGKRYLNL